MNWTAHDLQVAAARWCWASNVRLVVPNIFLFGNGESDLIAVTRAGYAWELEIKISRSDFWADMRKARGAKHAILSGARPGRVGPKRFYFVVPRGLVEHGEVPSHCGLIEVGRSWHPGLSQHELLATTSRPAPELRCGARLTERQLLQIATSLSHRYMRIVCSSKTSPPTSTPL